MDEVILRVSPKELSEFPCPFEGERNCDNNCDNPKKVTKNNQKKVTKVGININKGKDQLTSKVKKVRRRRGKKGSRKGNTEGSKETHHLPLTPPLVIHSITRPLLLDLRSCQKASLDKAHSLHPVTPVNSASLHGGLCVCV